MDIFEYLPQLIVAYDGNDEFASLIHVKNANSDINYFCPCCGGVVKPRALDSTKEQSHYYHITGKCTKESQLYFFCKNWLFEVGSKFYIKDTLFEVGHIDIEKTHNTKFGKYTPDITVYTKCGKTIYFEMFFSNRKTGDDYFCKWKELGNPVVGINLKEYVFKTDVNTIPTFSYLYCDGVCYSKPYVSRDVYANTIAKIKDRLTRQQLMNYKVRIEQLDWFWIKLQDNETTREDILDIVSGMEYDDMVSCYDIVKRKHCVAYLKDDILKIINGRVISDVRGTLNLPVEDNVYFDLKHIRGRTYEIGIRLRFKSDHITYDDFYYRCNQGYQEKYPEISFKRNILTKDELIVPDNKVNELKKIFDDTKKEIPNLIEYEKELCNLEEDNYKIRMKNGYYTVLFKNSSDKYEVLFENVSVKNTIEDLKKEIESKLHKREILTFLNHTKTNEKLQNEISELCNYKGIDSRFELSCNYYKTHINASLWLFGDNVLLCEILPKENSLDEIIIKYKMFLDDFIGRYYLVLNIIEEINNCKNKTWSAFFNIYQGTNYELRIQMDTKKYLYEEWGYKYLCEVKLLDDIDVSNVDCVKNAVLECMRSILSQLEYYGYRVMDI